MATITLEYSDANMNRALAAFNGPITPANGSSVTQAELTTHLKQIIYDRVHVYERDQNESSWNMSAFDTE
jgi:hypothetical protein|tara:strand:+ start:164 stop:373 length:210 start_codon:yes stop_codon:yes gene_type:complete